MSTKRQVIDSLRNKLKERNADSNFTNQFLYSTLLEHAKWLIKREIHSGRLYSNSYLFQTLDVQEVVETSTIDRSCPIRTKCKIYRTKHPLPEMWRDSTGPVIKDVTSLDGSTSFFMTTATSWQNKRNDPYQKMSSTKYVFYANDHLWFPEHNPHYIKVNALYMDDLRLLDRLCDECDDQDVECVRFLDTQFMVPDWLEAEMFAKAIEQMAGITKRLPDDNQIDKNPTRRD